MQSDEQQIRELTRTWMEATKAGDIEKVLSLMTDDVVFLLPGHPPMIGKPAYAAAAQGQSSGKDSPQFDGTSDIKEIQVLGEWAFMWQKLTVIVTPTHGAPPVKRAGHTLTIFRKQDGRWLLSRDANMLTLSG